MKIPAFPLIFCAAHTLAFQVAPPLVLTSSRHSPLPASSTRSSPWTAAVAPVGCPRSSTVCWQGLSAQPVLAAFKTLSPASLPVGSPQFIAWASMGILAVQFGIMPTLQKKFVPRKLCRSSMLLAQEVSKFALSMTCFLSLLNPLQRQQALRSWTVRSWWHGAGVPATLYAIQNYAKLMAYQHLSPVAYSVLNQTKTLTTALFCYWILGLPQSPLQVVALTVLLTSALVMEGVIPVRFPRRPFPLSTLRWKRRHAKRISKLFSYRVAVAEKPEIKPPAPPVPPASNTRDPYHLTRGVLPLCLANLTSGLAAALGQRAIQRRNLYLYGMELSSASFLIVLSSLLWSRDGKQIQREGWKRHWTAWIWLPIALHAIGGTLVGVVTKYAGSVKKGFALIFGVLLAGIFQKQWMKQEPITREQVVGALLACLSLWMHTSFPPKPIQKANLIGI